MFLEHILTFYFVSASNTRFSYNLTIKSRISMRFLFQASSHFNLANLITMGNITFGLMAVYFITQQNFFLAVVLAWMGGAFDIMDGKVARKYKLSNEFGVQLDSFADFLTFVLMPTFLIFVLWNMVNI